MQLVIAQMKHETNTFSPVPTPLERFARGGGAKPLEGEAAIRAFRGTGDGLGACIEMAEKAGAQYRLAIAAAAWPSGPVENDAFECIARRICDSVAQGCDAILLDLHGAMVTQSYEDGEGELVRRIREIAPNVPIAVSLDMHTNLYPELVERCQVIAGYQTYPHVDLYGTSMRAAKALFAMMEGSAKPTMAWGNRPMLPHVMRQSSLDSPNREIQARCIEMESRGALCASLFVGFPHADIRNAGLSAVVVTDGDPQLARKWCEELLDMAWESRSQWVYEVEPLARSFARARDIATPPVVLLDHYDNAASGGTMDTMAVLAGIIEARLDDVAAFAICDPHAVAAMQRAGLGAKVTLRLGGRFDMPSIGLRGQPLEVSGTVKNLTDGRFRNRGLFRGLVRRSVGPGFFGGPRARHSAQGHADGQGENRGQCVQDERHRASAITLLRWRPSGCSSSFPGIRSCRSPTSCASSERASRPPDAFAPIDF